MLGLQSLPWRPAAPRSTRGKPQPASVSSATALPRVGRPESTRGGLGPKMARVRSLTNLATKKSEPDDRNRGLGCLSRPTPPVAVDLRAHRRIEIRSVASRCSKSNSKVFYGPATVSNGFLRRGRAPGTSRWREAVTQPWRMPILVLPADEAERQACPRRWLVGGADGTNAGRSHKRGPDPSRRAE